MTAAVPPAGAGDLPHPMTAPSAGSTSDQVEALCLRLREAARQTGEAALAAKRRAAAEIVAEASRRAETEARSAIEQARTRLDREAERRLQIARLDARALVARCRWQELSSVLEEAAGVVRQLRERDPNRYIAALTRLLRQAAEHISSLPAGDATVSAMVQLNARDIPPLREALATESPGQTSVDMRFVAEDVDVLFVASSADATRAVDESLAGRLHRLDAELRLAAQEILFG